MFVTRHQKKRDYLKYIFVFVHIVFSLDFGFVKRRTVKSKWIIALLTLVSYIFNVAMLFVTLIRIGEKEDIIAWIFAITLINLHNIVVLSLNPDKSFYNLLKALNEIHSVLTSDGKNILHNYMAKVTVSWSVSIAVTVSMSYVHCSMFQRECPLKLGFFWIIIHVTSLLTVLIVCFFMLYSVYCELKVFVDIVKNSNFKIIYYLQIYKQIMDIVDKNKKLFDILYVGALLYILPNLFISVYINLSRTKYEDTTTAFVTRSLYIFFTVCHLFAPTVPAGLLKAKAEELKIILQERLLQERKQEHVAGLKLFASYVEARPLQLTLAKIVQVDWSLPLLILNYCISYQIALVQLTHLY